MNELNLINLLEAKSLVQTYELQILFVQKRGKLLINNKIAEQ